SRKALSRPGREVWLAHAGCETRDLRPVGADDDKARPRVDDVAAIRRPRGQLTAAARQAPPVAAVGVHEIDVVAAVVSRIEGKPLSVRRPGGPHLVELVPGDPVRVTAVSVCDDDVEAVLPQGLVRRERNPL